MNIRRAIFASKDVDATPALIPPVALAGSDQELVTGTTTAQLTGGSSYDLDGTITTYLWQEISGHGASITTPNAANTTVTGLVDGNTYQFRLTVTDNDTLQHSDDVYVAVDDVVSSDLIISATTPLPIGTGYLYIDNGQPYETINLSFTLYNTVSGCSADFSGAQTGILDHDHPSRVGSVQLDSNGHITKNYWSTWATVFQCVVQITGRSSAFPVPAGSDTVQIVFLGYT